MDGVVLGIIRNRQASLDTHSLHTLIERDNPSCWSKGCMFIFVGFWFLFAAYLFFFHDFDPPPDYSFLDDPNFPTMIPIEEPAATPPNGE